MLYALLQRAVWYIGIVAELLLLWELGRSRLVRSYPFFTAFLAWQVARVPPTMWAFRFSPGWYPPVYWFLDVISWILIFLVILELYDQALGHYSGFRRLARSLVLWAAVVLTLAVSASVSLEKGLAPGQGTGFLNDWLLLMLRSARMVHAGLLLALVLFLLWFRLKTAYLLYYFIWGWLAHSVLQVALASLSYQTGKQLLAVLSVARPLTFVVILFVWCWAVRQSRFQPHEELAPNLLLRRVDQELLLVRLEGLNAALTRALRQ